jgi:hypothetical protein
MIFHYNCSKVGQTGKGHRRTFHAKLADWFGGHRRFCSGTAVRFFRGVVVIPKHTHATSLSLPPYPYPLVLVGWRPEADGSPDFQVLSWYATPVIPITSFRDIAK